MSKKILYNPYKNLSEKEKERLKNFKAEMESKKEYPEIPKNHYDKDGYCDNPGRGY